MLVAHSFGGFNVRLYADTFPRDVAGMTLVDPSHEDQLARFRAVTPAIEALENGQAALMARCLRALEPGGSGMPPRSKPYADCAVLTSGKTFGIPGVSREDDLALHRVWIALHDELARLSDRGTNTIVAGASHDIQIDRPQTVITAVDATVAAARRRSDQAHLEQMDRGLAARQSARR